MQITKFVNVDPIKFFHHDWSILKRECYQSKLHEDPLNHIFNFLTVEEVLSLSTVSYQFYQVTKEKQQELTSQLAILCTKVENFFKSTFLKVEDDYFGYNQQPTERYLVFDFEQFYATPIHAINIQKHKVSKMTTHSLVPSHSKNLIFTEVMNPVFTFTGFTASSGKISLQQNPLIKRELRILANHILTLVNSYR